MPVNRRSPRPPNSTQIAGSRHRHRRQLWDYSQSACTPGPSKTMTRVSPRCVVRLRAFGRCQGVPATPVGRLAMRNAVRSTNLVTGAARTIGKTRVRPRAGSRVPPGRRLRRTVRAGFTSRRERLFVLRSSIQAVSSGTSSGSADSRCGERPGALVPFPQDDTHR